MTIWNLENRRFRASVSATGGELLTLWDKQQQKHWLWKPQPGVWNNSATQLFPVVGRLIHEGLWLGEQFLPLPAHGFLRQQPFRCLQRQGNQLLLDAHATGQTRACWPWRWRVQLRLSLQADGIRLCQSVRNEDATAFHYAIGWHPGFSLPIATQPGWHLAFTGGAVAGPFFTDNRTLAIPSDPPATEAFPLTAAGFQGGAVYFGDTARRRVEVYAPNGARVMSIETGDQPWLALWGVPGADLLCIEPLAGTTDDPAFGGQVALKRGMQTLQPGEEQTFETRIRFAVDA